MPAALNRDNEIVALYATGISQQDVADALGISQGTVSRRLRALGVEIRRASAKKTKAAINNLRAVNESIAAVHEARDGVIGKLCRICRKWQPLANFFAHKGTSDGLENRCRDCERVRSREYHRANREAVSLRRSSPERRQRHREYYREWERNRLANDPSFRMAKRLRNRVYTALNGHSKATRTVELIGCSIEELRAHLEAQFQDGMTWGNYGRPGWEIDHIRPCSSFDLTDPAQQLECFHYTNLQPLWGPENWKKGPRWQPSDGVVLGASA